MSTTSELILPSSNHVTGFAKHEERMHQPEVQSSNTNQKALEKTISCVSCRKRKLKCDRIKPKCGTCVRLRHECEYPERRRNLGAKRARSSKEKEIEARLAQLETRLNSEGKCDIISPDAAAPRLERNWNMGIDLNLAIDGRPLLTSIETSPPISGFSQMPKETTSNINKELLSLGLQEPLPPDYMIKELYHIYFTLYHPSMPIIHQARFYMSLERPIQTRPPICLCYAMWTLATTLSPKYADYEDIFYERARRYLERAEMKGHGESFVSLYFAQAWGLVCNYEARKMYFSRSWMSTGRMVRLVQMLGLWRLDYDEADAKDYLPPPKDWVELEERRRTFWAAFYSDRFASSGSGWPMIIQEHEVFTNLPSSEEAFESGIPEKTVSLVEAFSLEGVSRISVYAGVLLTSAFFGQFFQHVRGTGPSHHPEDYQNGEFWKRHRKMENCLNNTFIYLPEALRLPAGRRDMNVIFLHMNIQASIIGLHRTAVMTATRYNVEPIVVRQSRARTFIAAEEIVSIINQTEREDALRMVPWVGFCLHVAAGIFLDDLKSDTPNFNSYPNLEQILAAMRQLSVHHSITKGFLTQCELDIASMSKNRFGREIEEDSSILAESQGVPITVADMQALLLQPPEKAKKPASVNKERLELGNTSNASLSPQPPLTQALKDCSPLSEDVLLGETPEYHPWEQHIDVQIPRFDDMSYAKFTPIAQSLDTNGYVDYNHTSPITPCHMESNPISPQGLSPFEHDSPLKYVKDTNCVPIQNNVIIDDFNATNDWIVPDPFEAIDQSCYVLPGGSDWNQSKFPTACPTRGSRNT
ncbi:putative fungal specific transcription factor domain-containing protein [Erysiphe necator]|uniref:Putative fungal specific transcription factor domain-containing protein n=1 Tax=Uncinula necator TaxID=52586 RepID=A0A0B1P4E7_UNCNE|nr:putative fungal specific transcription factor domain-containing protein [Erysiphe necator]